MRDKGRNSAETSLRKPFIKTGWNCLKPCRRCEESFRPPGKNYKFCSECSRRGGHSIKAALKREYVVKPFGFSGHCIIPKSLVGKTIRISLVESNHSSPLDLSTSGGKELESRPVVSAVQNSSS